jgi:hypothetical protein
MTISIRNLPPAAGALVILFFFLPWVSVSCSLAPELKINASGYEMASGNYNELEALSNLGSIWGEPDVDRAETAPLMWLFPLFAIGGIAALSRSRAGLRLSLVSGILGLFALLAFTVSVLAYKSDASSTGFDIRFQYGYWLSWLAFGLQAGAAYAAIKEGRISDIRLPKLQLPIKVEIDRGPPAPGIPPQPISAGGVLAMLKFISGPMTGAEVPVTSKDILIGRGSTCDIRLSDMSVSRQHAQLRYVQGAWYIQDQGSSGGLFVNGNQGQAFRLYSGDRIALGSSTIVFKL